MNMEKTNTSGEEEHKASSPEHAPSLLTRTIGKLAFAASVVSSVLVVLTLAVTGFSVFRRYILGIPLTWSDELSGFLVVAIVMLGAAEVLRKNEHVSVDIITGTVTGRKKSMLDLWSNISVAAVAGVLFASALNAVQFSIKIGVYSDGYLEAPLWIPQSFLLVGAGLLFLLSAARAIDLVFQMRSN